MNEQVKYIAGRMQDQCKMAIVAVGHDVAPENKAIIYDRLDEISEKIAALIFELNKETRCEPS